MVLQQPKVAGLGLKFVKMVLQQHEVAGLEYIFVRMAPHQHEVVGQGHKCSGHRSGLLKA